MESTYIKKDSEKFPTLRTTKSGSELLFGQILYPLGPDDTKPTIEDYSTKELLAAKIKTEEKTDIFLKSFTKKQSSNLDLSLTGDFAWISLVSGNVHKASGQSVTNVTYNESPILESTEHVTFAIKLDTVTELGLSIENPTTITLHLTSKTTSITLNGTQVPFQSSDRILSFQASESGTYFIQ